MTRPCRSIAVAGALLVAGTGLAACSAAEGVPPSTPGVIQVVAAENFWGSLAAQLGGSHVHVQSIISDPNTDPHEYESTPVDARAFAAARYVILNGVGYDSWADQLLAAQPEPGRRVLTVGALFGKVPGDNPHLWYDPSYVFATIDRISADYESIEPKEASYFRARLAAVGASLAPYRALLGYIQRHFAGTPVASTESIFQYLATYLRLDLVTPDSFMKAVAEGNDPPAPAVATFENQIRAKAFKVLVYNVQTVTDTTTTIKELAAARNIPVTGISETIQPPLATFQEWMVGELEELANALNASALGR